MHIHMVSNSPWVNSGFGKVGRYLSIGLKKLGHEVSATGIQTALKVGNDYGIKCYPIDTGGHVDESTQLFLNIQNLKPDVLLYVGQTDADMNYVTKIFDKQIIYCPVEGVNIPDGMASDLKSVVNRNGVVIAQCEYGYNEMKKAGVDVSRAIYHGIDPSIFYPIVDNEMDKHLKGGHIDANEIVSVLKLVRDCDGKAKWQQYDISISELVSGMRGKYIYGFVGNNFGLRKQIPRLLKAYSILIKENRRIRDRSMLALHTLPMSIRGVNLIKVVHQLGIQDNVIFAYGSFGSSGWSEEAMNIWYNLCDVNVSASSSEGFCVLPDTSILTFNRGVQKIKNIKVGDKVLTHKGRFMRVSQVMSREYHGDMIKVIPHNLKIPIVLTPGHKVLAIKAQQCKGRGKNIICKPGVNCYRIINNTRYKRCKYITEEEPWRKYRTEWIDVRNLQKGDLVVYPKSSEKEVDIEKIRLIDYIDDFLNVTGDSYEDIGRQTDLDGNFVQKKVSTGYNWRQNDIPAEIELTKDLMRLFGYFIAEGGIADSKRSINFTFNVNETEYIEDVKKLMKNIFGLEAGIQCNDSGEGSCQLRYHSVIISNIFQNMFCPKEYEIKKGKGRKSNIVRIPSEFMNLPLDKLGELIKGEWYGDGGYHKDGFYYINTTSETLAWQLVYILSRYNILSSIFVDNKKDRNIKHENYYSIAITGKDIHLFEKIINYHVNMGEKENNKYIRGKHLFYVGIRDIEIIKYDGIVWNLEVEEDNSYVCPIVVHNCLPVIEGMASGVPMIAPNATSFVELIGNDSSENKNRGLLADIATYHQIQDGSERALVDEKDLALKMKFAYVEKDKMKVFSDNAIKFSEKYTWDKISVEFDKVLSELK